MSMFPKFWGFEFRICRVVDEMSCIEFWYFKHFKDNLWEKLGVGKVNIDKMRDVETVCEGIHYGNTIFKLFKLVFVTIAYYPDKIEGILRPHLGTIIMNSFKYSPKCRDPTNYFQVCLEINVILRSCVHCLERFQVEDTNRYIKKLCPSFK